MKKLNNFEDLGPLRRKITGEKRARIQRKTAPVRITEEELNSFEPIDVKLLRAYRQLDKENPLFEVAYEICFFGDWKPILQSEIADMVKCGLKVREVKVPFSRVKDYLKRYPKRR